MVSLSDRDLLLAIKTEESKPYDYHIDKIENFSKELKDYMFESDAILNIELLDYLASNDKYNDKFENLMSRFECYNAPLQFLSQYYFEGKQCKKVFNHYLEYKSAWDDILNWNNISERDNLIEAYLKYCTDINPKQQTWLNNNYIFLADHIDGIVLDKALSLIPNCKFETLSEGNDNLLDCVIEYCSYEINLSNLFIATKHLCKGNTTVSLENLNYSRIYETQNEDFVSYIQNNLSEVLSILKDGNKDESKENILYILNSPDINNDLKIQYLTGQHNCIDNLDQITTIETYDIAIKAKVAKPTWENVQFYYGHKITMSEILIDYINHYSNELSKTEYPETLKGKDDLYVALFGADVLDDETYKKLLPTFIGVFPETDKLENLKRNKIIILIQCGKLPFNEEMLKVINDSDVLTEYIVYHANEYTKHLDWDYNYNINNVYDILEQGKFTLDEMFNIIGTLPNNILQNSQNIANKAVEVFCNKRNVNIEFETLLGLLTASSDDVKKVQLAAIAIECKHLNHDEIKEFLNALGEEYLAICDKSKRAKLPNTYANKQLLTILKEVRYISSFNPKGENGEFLEVWHKKKND